MAWIKSTTLEDAVDVADSYAGINDKAIHDLILQPGAIQFAAGKKCRQ